MKLIIAKIRNWKENYFVVFNSHQLVKLVLVFIKLVYFTRPLNFTFIKGSVILQVGFSNSWHFTPWRQVIHLSLVFRIEWIFSQISPQSTLKKYWVSYRLMFDFQTLMSHQLKEMIGKSFSKPVELDILI